jgi:hypothetical protein
MQSKISSRPIKARSILPFDSELVSTPSPTSAFEMISKVYLFLIVALLALSILTTVRFLFFCLLMYQMPCQMAEPQVVKREAQQLDPHPWLKASYGSAYPPPHPLQKPNRQFKASLHSCLL